jgi:hypothetical protein
MTAKKCTCVKKWNACGKAGKAYFEARAAYYNAWDACPEHGDKRVD